MENGLIIFQPTNAYCGKTTQVTITAEDNTISSGSPIATKTFPLTVADCNPTAVIRIYENDTSTTIIDSEGHLTINRPTAGKAFISTSSNIIKNI